MHRANDPAKLADAQAVAAKLIGLPKEALLYIAGYVEGCRDRPKDKKTGASTNTQPPTTRTT